MPPQPLSNFRNYYTYNTGSQTLTHRPELAQLMAQCIAVWAEVEVALGRILCEALDAAAGPFAAIYQELTSSGAQITMAQAAIRHGLDDEKRELLDAVMMVFRSAGRERNKLAHGTWGWSQQIPDTLLMIDPKVRIRSAAAVQPNWVTKGNSRTTHGVGPEAVIGKHEIYMYGRRDFEELLERFERVEKHLTRFALCLIKDWPEGADIPRQLSNEPDIQEALARLRKGQKRS